METSNVTCADRAVVKMESLDVTCGDSAVVKMETSNVTCGDCAVVKMETTSADDSMVVDVVDSSVEDLNSDDRCENTDSVPDSGGETDESYVVPNRRGLRSSRRKIIVYSEGESDLESDNFSESESNDMQMNYEGKRCVQIHGPSVSSIPDVTVLTANNDEGRKWNNKDTCVFCMSATPELPRHFKQHHADEPEVKEALAFPLRSFERRKRLELLRNKGNHAHNFEVLREKKGFLIPYKQPTREIPAELYLPCYRCFGYFLSFDMRKHQSRCIMRRVGKPFGKLLIPQCALLLPTSTAASDSLKNEIIGHMQHDEVSRVARNDDLVVKLGMHILGEVRLESIHKYRYHKYISQTMREVARLLLVIQKNSPGIESLRECIDPDYFEAVLQSANQVAGLNKETGAYTSPYLAVKLGQSLKRCALIVKTDALKNEDAVLVEKAEGFGELLSILWPSDVSKGARTTMYERKWNKPTMLSVSTNVMKVHHYISETVHAKKKLLQKEPKKKDYVIMARGILVQLCLFNQRRSRIQKMTLDDYKHTFTSQHVNEDVMHRLSSWQKWLCTRLSCVVFPGQRGQKVPVLLTGDMVESINVLVEARRAVGVLDHNPHLFARPGWESTYCRTDSLKYFANKSGTEHPEYVTSTKLGKHVAALYQVLCLKDNELDALAGFLGHNIQIKIECYQLQENALQTAKVAKLLMLLENGNTDQLEGKSLDDIEVNLKVLDDCSEDESSDVGISEQQYKMQCIWRRPMDVRSLGKEQQRAKKKSKKEKIPYVRERRKWTPAEKVAVDTFFEEHVGIGRVPKKKECEACIGTNPALEGMPWPKIKFRIYNLIQERKGLKPFHRRPRFAEQQRHKRHEKRSHMRSKNGSSSLKEQQRDKRDEKPSHKRSKNESSSRKEKTSCACEHKQFTPAERVAVDTFFEDHIRIGRAPNKRECEDCIRTNPALEGIPWTKINFRIHYVIRKKQQRDKRHGKQSHMKSTNKSSSRKERQGAKSHEKQSHKRSKNGSSSRKEKTSRARERKRLMPAERVAVDTFFEDHVRIGRVPQKKDCEDCIRTNPALVGIPWRKIKFRVYYLIQKSKGL